MATTILTNAELIENARAASSKAYHDELSQKIREVFAGLNEQEVENALATCYVGKSYTIEILVSDIFKKEHHYDINNTLRMSSLFDVVKGIDFLESNNTNLVNARIWLRGDIRKFLNHKHHKC